MLDRQVFTAGHLIQVERRRCIPGNPAWAEWAFRTQRQAHPEGLRGPGIYAVGFRGTTVYVGKYLGKRKDVFGGNVSIARWEKHLGTLTLRSRYLSMRRKTLELILSSGSELEPFSDIAALPAVATLLHGRGCETTFNRVLFASQYWATNFRAFGPEALELFELVYVKVRPDCGLAADQLRQVISSQEERLIEILRPRCNAKIAPGSHRALSVTDCAQEIEDALRAALGSETPLATTENTRPWLGQSADGGDDARQMLPAAVAPGGDEEGEGSSADEAADSEITFFDRLEEYPEALTLAKDLSMLMDLADLDVHFTATNGADLRVACMPRRGESRIVATISWWPKRQSFKALLNLSPTECLALGATAASQKSITQHQTAEASFDFPASGNALLRCVAQSVLDFEAAHGRLGRH